MATAQTNARLAWDTVLDLGDDGAPLVARLERALRDAVHAGRVPGGSALPPSRVLAETLGVSRWVVTEVYGQLVAEGFCEARVGSGTRVATGAAAHAVPKHPARAAPVPAGAAVRLDLRPGVPDLRHVPRSAWLRALRDALADAPDADLGAPDPAGHPAARTAVVDYLARARSTCASSDDVVITHGAADGMARLARALRSAGHRAVLVEDPSWGRLRDVARDAGLVPVPVPVDDDGVDVGRLVAAADRTGARAALVTPAHQFPTGAALAPGRRDALVSWARDVDGLVIEDDYDAEFRYDRRPVAALQGHDPGRVALLGSLSKTVSPAFGLGWLVLPQIASSFVMLFTSLPGYIAGVRDTLLLVQRDYGLPVQHALELLEDSEVLMQEIYSLATSAMPQIVATLGSVASNFVAVFTAVASSIYMLSGKGRLLHQLRTVTRAFLPPPAAEQVLRLCHFANLNFTGFYVGKVIDSAIIGVLTFVLMSLLRLDFALLISVFVGITNIIPVFGPFIGAIPSIFILLLVDPVQALIFAVLILFIQQLDGNFIGPKILGQSIGISSLWVLFATLYGLLYEAVAALLRRRGINAEGEPLDGAPPAEAQDTAEDADAALTH